MMSLRVRAEHGPLVAPGGVEALRRAIGLVWSLEPAYAGVMFAVPRQRTASLPVTTVPRPSAPVDALDAPALPAGSIPVQAPPPEEPTGELATVMEIVARAQQGDAEAFGQLYDRYVDMVYRYIQYRVANAPLAEDLTSETFLRALRRITSYTWQGRDFGAWLVTIARNLIADHFKSGRYRLEVATADLVESGADRRAVAGPEDEVLAGLTNATLLEAVKRLNGEQQECIALRFLQGMSVSETARIMGKNDGAIKALQYRAVKTLSRLLPQDLV
jgi:RNA polymerase sigma-70 factor (ECF subfamily)